MKSFVIIVLAFLVGISLVSWALFWIKYKTKEPEGEQPEQKKKKEGKSEEKDGSREILSALGIGLVISLVLNLILFMVLPLWEKLLEQQMFFGGVNLALWLTISMFFVKENGTNPKWAMMLAKVFLVLTVVGISSATLTRVELFERETTKNIVVHRPTSIDDLAKRVPVEIAMEVVGYCESRNQHFETDEDGKIKLDANGKKIPRRNKGIPERGVPPSDAFGKYQYRELHRKLAAALGFDLNIEADQDWYFRYLYAKEGFGPWDHDEQYGGGRACWLPRLEALGFSLGSPDNPTAVIKVNIVQAPVANWSKPFPIPVGYNFLIDWADKKKKGVHKHRYTTSFGTIEKQFSNRSQEMERIRGDVTAIELMSLEEEPIEFSLVLTPK